MNWGRPFFAWVLVAPLMASLAGCFGLDDAAPNRFEGSYSGLEHVSGASVPQWRSFASRRGEVSTAWSSFVHRLGASRRRDLLARVNQEVNGVRYASDSAVGRPVNYWASPSEFLASGGDCKDYALAKYTALRSLGVPPSEMRILVTRQHAVLVVKTKDGPRVLDNLSSNPYPLDSGLLSNAVYTVSDAGVWLKVVR